MRVMLVLAPAPVGPDVMRRTISAVDHFFKHPEQLAVAAPDSFLRHYRGIKPDLAIVPYARDAAAATSDIIVFAECPDSDLRADRPDGFAQRVYSIDRYMGIWCLNHPLDAVDFPGIDAHVFNRIGTLGHGGEFRFFLFCPLWFHTQKGPINPFGFRIDGDYLHLKDRPANHKVIALVGGSCAWSWCCCHHEMFSQLIEQRLNRHCEDRKRPERFTVLNFGMPSGIVIHEMIVYLLFIQKVRPDAVLAHDGYNDLWWSMQTDGHLLNEYSINYYIDQEDWSRILHAGQSPLQRTPRPTRPHNLPQNVLKAYIDRKTQFRGIVEGSGAMFFSGLQPTVWSKKALAPRENEYLRKGNNGNARELFTPQRTLYERLSAQESWCKDWRHVDLHRYFGQFGGDQHLFEDEAHTLPLGDEKIADAYTPQILRWMGL